MQWTMNVTFIATFSLLFFFHVSLGAVVPEANSSKHPIILVPGDGGCRVYARRRGATNEEPELVWVSIKHLVKIKTLTKIFSLHYDENLHAKDNEEYEITFPGWGDTETVSSLDKEKVFGFYYDGLVDDLKQDPYFVSNRTMRGAPFDFRPAPYDNPQFFTRLKALIEETYEINNQQRVILIGHSMGCLLSVLFLEQQTDAWKKQYIRAFVSLAGPYGGAVKTLKVIASGENFHAFFHSPLRFREVLRSFSSMQFMTPDPKLWPADEPLIITHNTTYTTKDYKRFFDDVGYAIGYRLMNRSKTGIDFFKGPTGVDEVYCMYGTTVQTPAQLTYSHPNSWNNAFPNQIPQIIYGDGDGTVNLRSLEVCKHWTNVNVMPLPLSEHLFIMRDPRVLKVIRRLTGFKKR